MATIEILDIYDSSEYQINIVDVRAGMNTGGIRSVYKFCTNSSHVYTPPPFIFTESLCGVIYPHVFGFEDYPLALLERNYGCTALYNPITVETGVHAHMVSLLYPNKVEHIMREHCVPDTNVQEYALCRASNQFSRNGQGKSAFLQSNLVIPLILATLRRPDKVINMSGDRKALERGFSHEIGHSRYNCCSIVRVIVQKRYPSPGQYIVISAYPQENYSPN